jgi:hypothetical protein
MSLNTFRDVLLAQLEQADIGHLAVRGPLGPEVEIDTPTGQRILVMFDREGDLLSVEIAGEGV